MGFVGMMKCPLSSDYMRVPLTCEEWGSDAWKMASVRGSSLLLRFALLCNAAVLLLVPVPSISAEPSKVSVTQANFATTEGATERRVALVIGNSAYQEIPLGNTVHDATDMAAKLRSLGFDVVYRENLTITKIGSTLREFRSKLSPGAVALVFYAGHGLQIRGENYLPTVNAEIASEDDVPNQSLSLRQLLEILDESKTRVNLVFLDACRNNPFDRRFRSPSRGLAKVSAPSGTLIAYATRPGSVASDGSGRNGLYTEKLLGEMDSSLPIEQVLKRVLSSVRKISKGKQEPWSEGSLEGDFCFMGCADPDAEKKALLAEVTLWESIKNSRDPTAFDSYLSRYPNGTFVTLAAVARKKILDDLDEEKRRQAEFQRIATEKAEQGKRNQLELEAAQAKAAKEARDKAEAERLALIQREAATKAEEEKRRQTELQRIATEKAEQERRKTLAQEEAEAKARAEAMAKAESERLEQRQREVEARKAEKQESPKSNTRMKREDVFVAPTF